MLMNCLQTLRDMNGSVDILAMGAMYRFLGRNDHISINKILDIAANADEGEKAWCELLARIRMFCNANRQFAATIKVDKAVIDDHTREGMKFHDIQLGVFVSARIDVFFFDLYVFLPPSGIKCVLAEVLKDMTIKLAGQLRDVAYHFVHAAMPLMFNKKESLCLSGSGNSSSLGHFTMNDSDVFPLAHAIRSSYGVTAESETSRLLIIKLKDHSRVQMGNYFDALRKAYFAKNRDRFSTAIGRSRATIMAQQLKQDLKEHYHPRGIEWLS
ncbi:hypothetical protein ANCCAN_22333 [Ancylostoma caninum]|uniref:Uncharacterized protein n=1 Tax=Ancylostoma caninum TaxID=29170 RepID=A0A368FI32_ANCCA|nr:hypothetical protein ANCCAN_22333 [Ancylostoma caninum]